MLQNSATAVELGKLRAVWSKLAEAAALVIICCTLSLSDIEIDVTVLGEIANSTNDIHLALGASSLEVLSVLGVGTLSLSDDIDIF